MDKHIGQKALIIGAIAGTLPDLDVVLSPLFDDAAFMTVHRSVSHSIGLAVVLSIGLGLLCHWIWKKKYSTSSWIFAFFVAIFSHVLLDWCTTYGTRILSPFNDHSFSLNIIHVFEPIYTVLLLIGVGWKIFSKSNRNFPITLGLVMSTIYLFWAGTSKMLVCRHAEDQIKAHDIYYSDLIVTPTPMNTVLWNVIVRTEDGYYFANHSLFDKEQHIEFQFVKSEFKALKKIKDHNELKYYLQYCDGFPLVKIEDDLIKIYAVKFGPINFSGEPDFIMPLCVTQVGEPEFWIDNDTKGYGPVKSGATIWKRIVQSGN